MSCWRSIHCPKNGGRRCGSARSRTSPTRRSRGSSIARWAPCAPAWRALVRLLPPGSTKEDPMACNDAWLEIVSAWHDGAATPDEGARVRAHLDGCAQCRLDRSRFRLLGDALRCADRDPGPDRTSRTTMLRPGRGRLIAAALVAAAAVLVVVPRGARDGNRVVVDELEARHLTAFAKAAPCDFESADPAAVHAWIAEQFGQEVEVPTVPGARLLGARSCSLSGATTVSLMYRRGDEPLSL